MTIQILDSYSESNYDGTLLAIDTAEGTYAGQSFTNNSSNATLDSVKFYLGNFSAASGNVFAFIYAHSGTYGTTSIPTGSALATSDAVDVTSIPNTISPGPALITFNFSGANRITLNSGTHYCAVFNNQQDGEVDMGASSTPLAGSGNLFFSTNNDGSSWVSNQLYNAIFYVYGDVSGGGGGTSSILAGSRALMGVGI